MKKRIFSLLGLTMLMLSLSLSLVGCGDGSSVKGISLYATCDSIDYDSTGDKSNVDLTVAVTNNNTNCCVERFVYCLRFYDAYGQLLEAREYTYTASVERDERFTFRLFFDRDNMGSIGGNVARVSAVPVSMELGAAEPTDGKPVFTDVSTWGIGAWVWVIIAGIFALGGVFDIIGAVTEFVDWGDYDTEEGWGMLVGGVVCAVITVVILVILF